MMPRSVIAREPHERVRPPVPAGRTTEELIRDHLPLARRAASRAAPPGARRDDAYGDALVGLWNAAREYDPGRKVRFSTWAWRKVRWAVLDGARSRSRCRRAAKCARPFDRAASLDAPGGGGGEPAGPLGAALPAAVSPPGARLEAREEAERLTRWMAPRDRDALLSWLGGEAMASIARRQGCCESWVSMRLKAALEELKWWFAPAKGQGGAKCQGWC